MPFTLSKRGLKFIQKWEGFYPKAYKDSVGVWTIGWGTITDPKLGIVVYPGQEITRDKALEWLLLELNDKIQKMNKLVKVPLKQHQADTLISFTFNAGLGNLTKSTLLRELNKGNYDAVPAQLARYRGGYIDGVYTPIKGLMNRRADEGRLWNNKDIQGVDNSPDTNAPAMPEPKEGEVLKPIIKPEVKAGAATEAITKSRTGKAGLGQMIAGGFVAMNAALINHPMLLALGIVVTLAGAYVIYRKWDDIREFAGKVLPDEMDEPKKE